MVGLLFELIKLGAYLLLIMFGIGAIIGLFEVLLFD